MAQETEKQEQDLISRPNHLKLVKADIEAFAGIAAEDGSLVILFDNDNRIIEARGDQNVGKTSFLNFFLASMGYGMPDNATNSILKSRKGELVFEHDGKTYKAKMTTTAFTLSIQNEIAGKTTWSAVNKPIEMLRTLIGPIGVSPEFLRGKKAGAEQIEWIKSLTGAGGVSEKEKELTTKYDESYKIRTGINAEYDRHKTELLAMGFHLWDTENKIMNATPKLAEVQAQVDAAPPADTINQTYNDLDTKRKTVELATLKVDGFVETKKSIQKDIEELELKLIAKKQELEVIDGRITEGTKFIADQKYAPGEYLTAKENMENAGKIALAEKSLADAKAKFVQFQDAEASKSRVNNILTNLEKEIKELAKEYTPDIKGLEIVTANIDDTRKEGVYLNGTNIAYLSESELWDLCLQVWKLQGVCVVFIENTSSLGSDAIARVNWFADNGGYVFASTMQRNFKELKVSFIKSL